MRETRYLVCLWWPDGNPHKYLISSSIRCGQYLFDGVVSCLGFLAGVIYRIGVYHTSSRDVEGPGTMFIQGTPSYVSTLF